MSRVYINTTVAMRTSAALCWLLASAALFLPAAVVHAQEEVQGEDAQEVTAVLQRDVDNGDDEM